MSKSAAVWNIHFIRFASVFVVIIHCQCTQMFKYSKVRCKLQPKIQKNSIYDLIINAIMKKLISINFEFLQRKSPKINHIMFSIIRKIYVQALNSRKASRWNNDENLLAWVRLKMEYRFQHHNGTFYASLLSCKSS